MKLFALVVSCFLFIQSSIAQELNARVVVNFSQVNNGDKNIYKTFETAVTEFLNTRKWTNDNFQSNERINCQFNFIIEERTAANKFKATVQIQSSRPVYNSAVNSVVFLHSDKDWIFDYTEFQPLDFNDQAFTTNLTSLLAYYAYVIIGIDYDSFSKEGGTKFFEKANTIVNTCQNATEPGWKSNDGQINRFWLINGIMNTQLASIRNAVYTYHRSGLDAMYDDVEKGRLHVEAALNDILKAHRIRPNSMFQQLYMNAKAEELIKIFKNAPPETKARIMTILQEIDASNGNKYSRIMN